ncbi:MAG: SWF/SNF helicase family protein, partial [Nitrososphaera sp.]|nr:SWF/SNF helicase family protein [Nitrososphaera sp.]
RQIKEEFFLWYDDGDPKPINAIIAQLIRLRQVNLVPNAIEGFTTTDSGKMDQAVEIVHELVMEGEQVLVWSSNFNGPIFELKRRLDGILGPDATRTLTGADTNRIGVLTEDFRQGKYKVLIGNMSAGAEGLNLHKNPVTETNPSGWPGGSSHVVILDRWYNPARNEQAIGRCDRPGIPESVTVHWINNRRSIDNWLIAMNELKETYATNVGEAAELRREYCSRDWLMDNI